MIKLLFRYFLYIVIDVENYLIVVWLDSLLDLSSVRLPSSSEVFSPTWCSWDWACYMISTFLVCSGLESISISRFSSSIWTFCFLFWGYGSSNLCNNLSVRLNLLDAHNRHFVDVYLFILLLSNLNAFLVHQSSRLRYYGAVLWWDWLLSLSLFI